MEDLKVEVQKKIIETVATGTFYPVTYEAHDTLSIVAKVPVLGGTAVAPTQVLCNEVSAGASDSVKQNSRGKGYSLRNWRFECRIDFAKEVSLSFFFTQELKDLIFEVDGFMVSVSLADYTVEHPVQLGGHTGT